MSQSLNIIIVEKTGTLKSLIVKDFKKEELFKKCGFKKSEDFIEQTEWHTKISGIKYYIQVFAKSDGRANNENKYDFPPPIDNKLFFGNCAIIAFRKEDKKITYLDLTLELWNKIYEKLFGGFEDLACTADEDEEEEDELANIPEKYKTKDGYLKDGFVVDNSEVEEFEDLGSELSEEEYNYTDDSN